MAWTPTKTTVADYGLWEIADTWSPSGIPTIDDHVRVDHITAVAEVGRAASIQLRDELWMQNGSTLIIKDGAPPLDSGAHFEIAANGNIVMFGSGIWVVKSENAQPAYRLRPYITSTCNASILDLSHAEFRGSAIYLGAGDGVDDIWFNTGRPEDGVVSLPAPLRREQRFVSHFVEGRNYSRVYRRGGEAGTTELRGIAPMKSFVHLNIQNMMESGKNLRMISPWLCMPACLIESFRPGTRDGVFVPFTIGLIEKL